MKYNTLKSFLFLFFIVCLAACQNHNKKHHHEHPSGGGVRHDFSNAEKWSKKFDNPTRDKWQRPQEIIKAMKLKKGEKVADIGAGTGYLLPHLSQAVGSSGKVYALDVDSNLVKHMKKRIKKESLKNTTAKIIPENSPGDDLKKVSKVVFLNTWHHVPHRKEYSKTMYKNLPQKASVFVVDPEKGAGGPGPRDSHRMKASVVIAELSSANFSCKEIKEGLKYQYIVHCQK